MATSHIKTSLSAGWFCQAFVLHDASFGVVHRWTLNSRGQLKLKKGPNKFGTAVTILSCHDCCDDDNDCEDFEGRSTTSRRSKRSNNEQLHRQDTINRSRREFFAWNSILAGIASGSISVDGTNAKEIANTIITPSPTAVNNNIINNNNDHFEPYSSVRRYKTIELSNKMKVLLVSDKTAIQSSAALTINNAGQFSDPPYLNGLAHLMEHITLSCQAGSTWSNQGDFQEWIDSDNAEGFSNGFTAYEKVCFHFQCKTDRKSVV